jgi:hypothetical protein
MVAIAHRDNQLTESYKVSCWLRTVLTAPDKQRLLLPQQATFAG